MENEKKSMDWVFSSQDELMLHQLYARKDWVEKIESKNNSSDAKGPTVLRTTHIPRLWQLSENIELYDWQKECINLWFQNDYKGTIKVVTGAGKTYLALGIMQKLQNDVEKDLDVAIIVPTIVLMNQWFDEITTNTNITDKMIGFLGSGYNDRFDNNKRILLCVLNSAQKKLPTVVKKSNCGDRLLLIVDECHRAGASIMKNIFDTDRRFSLGLSATPERNDDNEDSENLNLPNNPDLSSDEIYDDSLLGRKLGNIIYKMDLDDAFKMGILPPYEISHYGLPLSPNERQQYELLKKEIKDMKDKLWKIALSKNIYSNSDFIRWCNKNSESNSESKQKRMYLSKIRQRKSLIYKAESRQQAVISLLIKELNENADLKAILFHEDINEAMELWAKLVQHDICAVPENSKLSNSVRKKSIELFREGTANVLVSVKSLVEGFNVPSADLGIVVASSTSTRQRIQTLGRMLRKHKTTTGEDKNSKIYILYIEGTVDELTYSKTDWDSLTGAERNNYFKWNPDPTAKLKPVIQPEPPAKPLPDENNISVSNLKSGDVYPGKYEGREYTADSEGNIFLGGIKEKLIANPQDIPEKISKIKGSYGKFKITHSKKYVLVSTFAGEEWVTRYVTTLEDPFVLATKDNEKIPSLDFSILRAGDNIEVGLLDVLTEYGYKKKTGKAVITKKVKLGEMHALTSANAVDKEKGIEAEKLIQAIETVEKQLGEKISKIKISPDNIVFLIKKGKPVFIHKLKTNLEFPG